MMNIGKTFMSSMDTCICRLFIESLLYNNAREMKHIATIFTILTLISGSLNARQLIFTGKVANGFMEVSNPTIEVRSTTGKVKHFSGEADGSFTIHLPYNEVYTVSITKEDLVKKKVEVNTYVPSNQKKQEMQFDLGTLDLFNTSYGIDYSILNQPIAQIKWNREDGRMNFNHKFNKNIQAALRKMNEMVVRKRAENPIQVKEPEVNYFTTEHTVHNTTIKEYAFESPEGFTTSYKKVSHAYGATFFFKNNTIVPFLMWKKELSNRNVKA